MPTGSIPLWRRALLSPGIKGISASDRVSQMCQTRGTIWDVDFNALLITASVLPANSTERDWTAPFLCMVMEIIVINKVILARMYHLEILQPPCSSWVEHSVSPYSKELSSLDQKAAGRKNPQSFCRNVHHNSLTLLLILFSLSIIWILSMFSFPMRSYMLTIRTIINLLHM